MALVACRECGKQISDQAEVCPSCGIRAPAGVAPQPAAAILSPADTPILTMGNVVVTRTLAKFPAQTFPINGVGSVTLVAPKQKGLIVVAIFFLLLGVLSLSNSLGFAIFMFGVGGFFLFIAMNREHGLVIKTASGDVRAMEGDAKALSRVKLAIEQAATLRG